MIISPLLDHYYYLLCYLHFFIIHRYIFFPLLLRCTFPFVTLSCRLLDFMLCIYYTRNISSVRQLDPPRSKFSYLVYRCCSSYHQKLIIIAVVIDSDFSFQSYIILALSLFCLLCLFLYRIVCFYLFYDC